MGVPASAVFERGGLEVAVAVAGGAVVVGVTVAAGANAGASVVLLRLDRVVMMLCVSSEGLGKCRLG